MQGLGIEEVEYVVGSSTLTVKGPLLVYGIMVTSDFSTASAYLRNGYLNDEVGDKIAIVTGDYIPLYGVTLDDGFVFEWNGAVGTVCIHYSKQL
jgi:hypothetical protein